MKPSCDPDVLNLLDAVRDAGVSLWVDNDHLHIWSAKRLSSDQLAALKEHRVQVMRVLRLRAADLLPKDADTQVKAVAVIP